MKAALVLLVIFLFISCRTSPPTPRAVSRQELLETIDKCLAEHPREGAIRDLREIAVHAGKNFSALADVAGIMARVQYHSAVLLDVAESAAGAERESACFNDLALLAVLKLSESTKVMELAEKARHASTDGEFRVIDRTIRELKREAELKTLEEAVAYSHQATI